MDFLCLKFIFYDTGGSIRNTRWIFVIPTDIFFGNKVLKVKHFILSDVTNISSQTYLVVHSMNIFRLHRNLEEDRHKCLENPTPSKVFKLPPYTQAIQPYEHGPPYTKRTCLWLQNLPLLVATNNVTPNKGWTDKHRNPKMRSKTFQGIADAMATQWTSYILKQHNTLST